MNIDLPLDDGFLRRQCPKCNAEFKWHHGPVDGAPMQSEEGDEYFCPLCGQASDKESFWTHEQVNHMDEAASSYGNRMVQDMLADAFRGSKSISYKPGDVPGGPVGLFEPADMMEVQAPCHPWEPVKVPEDWSSAIHCLVCGAAFRV